MIASAVFSVACYMQFTWTGGPEDRRRRVLDWRQRSIIPGKALRTTVHCVCCGMSNGKAEKDTCPSLVHTLARSANTVLRRSDRHHHHSQGCSRTHCYLPDQIMKSSTSSCHLLRKPH